MRRQSKEQQLVSELRILTKNPKFSNKDLISWAGKPENLKYNEEQVIAHLSRFGVYCVIPRKCVKHTSSRTWNNKTWIKNMVQKEDNCGVAEVGGLRALLHATCPVCEKKIEINKDTHCGIGCDCVNNTSKLLNKLKEVISQRNRAIMENSYLHAKVEAWQLGHKDIKERTDKFGRVLRSVQEKIYDFKQCVDSMISNTLERDQ